MPLGAPIVSGLGIRNPYNIKIILETVTVPVIVDAGVGTASDAAIAMELGCEGVLMNTAISGAQDPVDMARAMRLGVEAGRLAFRAGRIGKKLYATASSPLEAELKGADWVVFGPVYDTPSKRAYGPPQGVARLERVAATVRLPVIAIGGINPERVREVQQGGARGVAVISAILAAESPGDATRRFLEALAGRA